MKEVDSSAEQFRSFFTTFNSQQLLKQVLHHLHADQNLQVEQLIKIFQDVKQEQTIPLSIFSSRLFPAEALCKYLREEENLSYHEIAAALNRKEKSVWTAYQRARKKMRQKFAKKEEKYFLPILIFQNRSLSLLENVIFYMNKVYKMPNRQVALLLRKSPNSMAVLLKRARRKHE